MKTLDEIKEMKIPVNTPIELTVNAFLTKDLKKSNETYKVIGYFNGLEKNPKGMGSLKFYSISGRHYDTNNPVEEKIKIPLIEEIRILGYKK